MHRVLNFASAGPGIHHAVSPSCRPPRVAIGLTLNDKQTVEVQQWVGQQRLALQVLEIGNQL